MKFLFRNLLLVACFLFLIVNHTVNGQDTTTNCDVCGYCQGVASVGDYKNPPSDWAKCATCMYPKVGDQVGHNLVNSDALLGNTVQIPDPPVEGLNTPDPNSHYTMIGCISTQPGKFTSQLTTFSFSVVGGVAFLFLIYGAGIIATSRADYEKLNQGKRIVYGAIAGLLFVLFATLIIRLIAVDFLKIPGFGQ